MAPFVKRAVALFAFMLLAAVMVGPSGATAAGGERCGRIFTDDYFAKVVQGDISCKPARRVLKKFSNNAAEDGCPDGYRCTSASPRGWKCANTHRNVDGVRPGVVFNCKRSDDKIAVVYTGPRISGN